MKPYQILLSRVDEHWRVVSAEGTTFLAFDADRSRVSPCRISVPNNTSGVPFARLPNRNRQWLVLEFLKLHLGRAHDVLGDCRFSVRNNQGVL